MDFIQPEQQTNLVLTPAETIDFQELNQDTERVKDYKAQMIGISETKALSDVPSLEQQFDVNLQRVNDGDEDSVRTNLVMEQNKRRSKVVREMMEESVLKQDEESFKDLLPSYRAYVEPNPQDLEKQKTFALEAETADKIQVRAVADNTQANAIDEDLGGFTWGERARSQSIKAQIFAEEVSSRMAKWDAEQSTLGVVTDIAGMFLPVSGVFEKSGLVDLPEGTDKEYTITSGSRFAQEQDYFWNQIPDQDFRAATITILDRLESDAGTVSFNASQAKALLNNMYASQGYGNTVDEWVDNAMDGLDVGLSGASAIKTGLNIARNALRLGDAAVSTELNAAKIMEAPESVNATRTITMDEAVTDSLPSALVPIRDLAGANLPEKVAQNIEKLTKIGDRVKNIQSVRSLNATELDTVPDLVRREVEKGLGRVTIADVKVLDKTDTSLTVARVRLGKQDGSGWSRKDGVVKAMSNKGLDAADYKPVKATDGTWYADLDKVVDESRVIDGFEIESLAKSPVKQWWNTYVSNTSVSLPKEFYESLSSGAFTEGYIRNQIFKPLEKRLAISNEGRKTLSAVVEEARDAEIDLSYNQLAASWLRHSGKQITSKEATAYYAAKQISNTVYNLANKSVYEDLARSGQKTIEIDNLATGFSLDYRGGYGKGRHGKVVTDNPGAPIETLRIYNASDNIKYRQGQIDSASFQRLREEGFELVKVRDAVTVERDPYNYLIIRRNDLKVRELDAVQLNYKAGTIGSRLYQGKWFVKQQKTGTFSDGGKYRMNPITHTVGLTKTEVTAWANKMEDARLAFKEYKAGSITKDVADARIAGTGQVDNVEDFQRLVDEGEIVEDSKFEVLFDRERPTLEASDYYDFSDNVLSPLAEFYNQSGRAVFGVRGDRRLAGPQDEAAGVLDVFNSLSRGINTALRSGAFDSIRNANVDRWYSQAKKLGILKPEMNSSSKAFLDENPYLQGVDNSLVSRMELVRKPLKRALSVQTKEGDFYNQTVRSIGEWVESGRSYRDASAAVKWYDMMDKNPITALRGFAFNIKLGLFAPGQLLIQSQQMFAAAAISPVEGVKSMYAMPWVRLALANSSDNLTDYMVKDKNISTMIGWKADEFKLYMKELRESGIADVGGNIAYLDQYSNTANMNRLSRGVNKFSEMGRNVFFYEAERWNRITAHGIAWREFRKKFPDSKIDSSEGRQWIKGRTDVLTNNMMNNSAAYWNKGILSYPTQFLAYHERLVSSILPVFAGGSNKLTGLEKARLATGQALFYGTAGIPFGTAIYENILEATGHTPSEEEYKNITSGFFDHVLRNYLNTDVNFAKRTAVGSGLTDLWYDIADGDFTEIMAGPTFNISGQVYDSLKKAAILLSAGKEDNWDVVTVDALAEVAKNISSFSNANKAYWMYNYNRNFSNTGKEIDRQAYTLGQEIMQILSISPYEVSAANDLYVQNRKALNDADLKRMTDLVRNYHLKAMTVGTVEEYERSASMIQALMQGMIADPEERYKVMQNIMRTFSGEPEYNRLLEQHFNLYGAKPINQMNREEQ